MPGIRRTLCADSPHPDAAPADAARALAEHRAVLVTDEHGPALRDFLRCAPATVWIAGPRQAPVQHLLAAIDPRAPDAITSAVIDIAGVLRRTIGVELFAAHAWSAPGELLLATHASAKAARRYVASRRDDAERAFDECLQRAGVECRRICEHDEPVALIERLVRELDIDAVVLGTRPRSRIARALLGCTAERVARCTPVHVIVAKPSPPRFDVRLPRAIVLPRAA